MNRPQIQEVRNPALDNVVDLGQFRAPKDVRMERTKQLIVDIPVICQLLQMDGKSAIRMEGFPKGSLVIGVTTRVAPLPDGTLIPQLAVLLHHPSFPVNEPGTMGEVITVFGFPVVPEDNADASAGG